MKKTNIWQSVKRDKISIIVLVAAAVIFIVAIVLIYSEDILNMEKDIFNVYGDELVEFEKASVDQILSEDIRIDEDADRSYVGSQELEVTVRSGRYRGKTMVAYNYFGPLNGIPVSAGDGVVLTIKTHAEGDTFATVYEFNRIPLLAIFILLFFLAVIIIGGRTGLKSMIGLILTILCLFTILIPLILKGAPPVLTTFFICVYIALVCFTILGGVNRKTVSAFLGTVSGALLAMLFGLAAQHFVRVNGYMNDAAEPLLQLKYYGDIKIQIKGLMVSSIIICALGAVMDVAMSISSALEEVHAANPSLQKMQLFRSGMNIGRDMVGTMTNTLILAFLGSQFSLVIFLYSRGLTFYHLFSTIFVSVETISGISSSIGMVLAIPLTALISSMLITQRKR